MTDPLAISARSSFRRSCHTSCCRTRLFYISLACTPLSHTALAHKLLPRATLLLTTLSRAALSPTTLSQTNLAHARLPQATLPDTPPSQNSSTNSDFTHNYSLSFLPSPYRFNPCLYLLEEVDLWGYPVLFLTCDGLDQLESALGIFTQKEAFL